MIETSESESLYKKLLPFTLTLFIIGLDQFTKYLIVRNVPLHTSAVAWFNDFIRIIHVRNLGIAFSMGRDLSGNLRSVLFAILPIIILVVVVIYYFISKEVKGLTRWALAGIVGGGIGNIIDRIARSEGVVDFIDVKFFGILGLERFPTFNVADSSVVVCGILLVVAMIVEERSRIKMEGNDE